MDISRLHSVIVMATSTLVSSISQIKSQIMVYPNRQVMSWLWSLTVRWADIKISSIKDGFAEKFID